MTVADLFHLFVYGHIATGSIGLVAFWLPVLGKKGGTIHRRAGLVFVTSMLATGSIATLIALTTLIDPIGTHPHLAHHPDFGDAATIRGIFGWMMIFLAMLTVNLAWHGWLTIRHKRKREPCREWRNLSLQAIVFIAAANCLVHGLQLGQVLMIGISMVGFATVITNLWYLYRPTTRPLDWLIEHFKCLVGAGISVYTAFLAFGSVRLLPEAALTPALWAVPFTIGLAIILYHRRDTAKKVRSHPTRPSPRAPMTPAE